MSIDLLVVDSEPDLDAVVAFGGIPDVPAGIVFAWPTCASCDGPLQYLGRVPHPVDPSKRVLVFMCGNDPGMCDEWDAEGGGNLALVVDATGRVSPATPPADGVTSLDGTWSGHVVQVDASSYWEALDMSLDVATGRQILGLLRGQPVWIQGDETPTCPACGQPMMLAAQLEEGPDHRTAMNFGDAGCGYVFACACPADQARFLWQCG